MTGTTKSWRTLFPVHPAADVFPMMSADELHELGADIKAHGLRHPVVLWQDNADTHLRSRAPYYVLDGRNRLAAMDLAGIPVPADPLSHRLDAAGPVVFDRVCAWAWIEPGGKWEKTPGVDPAAVTIGANVRRRHLTKQAQADLIVKAVQASEEFLANLASNREAVKSATETSTSEPPDRCDRCGAIVRASRPHKCPTAGRRADPIKEKAVREGEKQGIAKRTIERSLARQEDRPKTPSKPTLTLAPEVELMRAEQRERRPLTYKQQLEAKVAKAERDLSSAIEAVDYKRERLADAKAVLANYQAKRRGVGFTLCGGCGSRIVDYNGRPYCYGCSSYRDGRSA